MNNIRSFASLHLPFAAAWVYSYRRRLIELMEVGRRSHVW